jgi:hypothetical protein
MEPKGITEVVAYLKQAFPGAAVWDSPPESARLGLAHSVSVATSSGVLIAIVSVEFLRDSQPPILSRLQNLNVAGAMAEAGPSRRLLITREGLSTISIES